jgi:hypothetical protein
VDSRDPSQPFGLDRVAGAAPGDGPGRADNEIIAKRGLPGDRARAYERVVEEIAYLDMEFDGLSQAIARSDPDSDIWQWDWRGRRDYANNWSAISIGCGRDEKIETCLGRLRGDRTESGWLLAATPDSSSGQILCSLCSASICEYS